MPDRSTEPQSRNLLAYQRGRLSFDAKGWYDINYAQFDAQQPKHVPIDPFPYRCCICLNENHLRWRLPENEIRRNVKIPICRDCLNHWERRRRVFVGVMIAVLMGMTLLALALPLTLDRESKWRWLMAIVYGGFWILCRFAFCAFALPVQLWPTASSGLYIRFRNPEFMRLVDKLEADDAGSQYGGDIDRRQSRGE